MKTFVYPSILQKQAMPPLKAAGGARNVIIRYREMNGIKLTVFLPMLHNQIKFGVTSQAEEDDTMVGSFVLCNSQMRAAEVTEFLTELTCFCNEIVEIVNVDESIEGCIAKLQQIKQQETSVEGSIVFKKSVVLVGTPGNLLKLYGKKNFTMKTHSVVLDKVDLLQAMDFKDEIVSLGDTLKDKVNGKIIFTTNVSDEKDLSAEEQEDYKDIKAAMMGDAKALIVKMND